MTDLELTKACAERMGIRISGLPLRDYYHPLNDGIAIVSQSILDGDAQCMAMVKKFRLSVGFNGGWECTAVDERGMIIFGAFHHETLNRAIVECVARLI